MQSNIHIIRDGNQEGPFTELEIREQLVSGRINLSTLAWSGGSGGREPIPAILERMGTGVGAGIQGRPRLWNPNAAASWSILLSPCFGALLHAQNWSTLGNPSMARTNRVFFWVLLGIPLISALVVGGLALSGVEVPQFVANAIPLGLLFGWYFGCGKRQVEWTKTNLPGGYEKRPMWKAVLMGFAIVIAFYVIVFGVIFTAASVLEIKPKTATPDEIATTLEQTLRPSILETVKKLEKSDAVTMGLLDLSPVDPSGTQFSGTISLDLPAGRETFPIEVTYDRETDGVEWKLVPKE
jgi:hypothetical protein